MDGTCSQQNKAISGKQKRKQNVKLSPFSMDGTCSQQNKAISGKQKRKHNVKLSPFSMDGTCSQQNKAIPGKRKRKHNVGSGVFIFVAEIYDDLSSNKQNLTGIDNLSDDMLIAILSRMSLKEAARTSVLSRRWKYLWMSAFGTLEFDDKDTATGTAMRRKKFKSCVDSVLKIHQPRKLHGLIIHFSNLRRQIRPVSISTYRAIDSWISFAIQKEVQRFELDFSLLGWYEFPNIQKLLSLSYEVRSPFRSLRSLRLVEIDIKDEVVQYFLASCPHLEQLCIDASNVTKDIQFFDPLPNLKILEITNCRNIQSLEISAANLFSFTYSGKKISLPFEKIPNLSELTLGEDLCDSFIFEPREHSSYSVQLVKLVLNVLKLRNGRAVIAPPDLPQLPQLCSLKRLELQVFSMIGRSLLFFTSLIKASPQLREFRIEIIYSVSPGIIEGLPFPAVSAGEAVNFVHENLKVVEMAGFVGCSSEEEFLWQLLKIALSLEMVVIDTESEYYDDPELALLLAFTRELLEDGLELGMEIGATTRTESKERAKHLISTFPQEIKFVVK